MNPILFSGTYPSLNQPILQHSVDTGRKLHFQGKKTGSEEPFVALNIFPKQSFLPHNQGKLLDPQFRVLVFQLFEQIRGQNKEKKEGLGLAWALNQAVEIPVEYQQYTHKEKQADQAYLTFKPEQEVLIQRTHLTGAHKPKQENKDAAYRRLRVMLKEALLQMAFSVTENVSSKKTAKVLKQCQIDLLLKLFRLYRRNEDVAGRLWTIQKLLPLYFDLGEKNVREASACVECLKEACESFITQRPTIQQQAEYDAWLRRNIIKHPRFWTLDSSVKGKLAECLAYLKRNEVLRLTARWHKVEAELHLLAGAGKQTTERYQKLLQERGHQFKALREDKSIPKLLREAKQLFAQADEYLTDDQLQKAQQFSEEVYALTKLRQYLAGQKSKPEDFYRISCNPLWTRIW